MRIVVTILLLFTAVAFGDQILFQHSGGSNPLSEGWTQMNSGANVAIGATNDLGTDAWIVDDNGSSGLVYAGFPTAGEHATAFSSGWSLRAEVRVLDNSNLGVGPMFMDYNFNNRRFVAIFDTDTDGDPVINIWNGTDRAPGLVYTNQNAGSTYHLYEIVFDAAQNSADLFIDGMEIFSDFPGVNNFATDRVGWGAGSNPDTGEARFSFVEFTIVPEPSSLLLLALGGLLTLRRRCA